MDAQRSTSAAIARRFIPVAALAAAASAGAVPVRAQTPAAAMRCGFPPPSVAPSLVSPREGATASLVNLRRIVLQVFVPRGNSTVAPSLDDERVELDDGSSYPTEAGILRLVDPLLVPPDAPPLRVLDASLSGDMRYVSTWVPPLKADTQYTVRISLPYRGACVYADVGTFATGADDAGAGAPSPPSP